MSGYYQPDDSAYPNALDAIKLLSQRDVALHIPVNFVPVAGVSIATCSLSTTYDTSILKCFSNLLAAGFRRFDVDVYWDESRNLWSLCPVQLNVSQAVTTSSASSTATRTSISLSSTSTGNSARRLVRELENNLKQLLDARQTAATSVAESSGSSVLSSPSTTITKASQGTATSRNDSTSLIRSGSYECAPELDLGLLLSVLVSHLELTENNLNATTNYLSLNVHAARSNPAVPPAVPSQLPSNNHALSLLINGNASDYLYTPDNLQLQRANLNATGSWYNVPADVLPDSSYFNVTRQESTTNGWPTESFVEFTRIKRLLITFGTVSSEMSGYNFSYDAGTIFQSGYLASNHSYDLSATGSLQNGCFYNPGTTDLQAVNNSWAVAYTKSASPQALQYQFSNLSDCGFTAILNSTLNNVTAAQDVSSYGRLVLESIWSWDTIEPREDSGHCAVLNATSGRWQAEGCSAAHRCACDPGTPYGWEISNQRLSYDRTDQACPSGSSFGVSRTALENSYLVNAWRTTRTASSISDELLWVNLNDLNVAGCWVEGQNTTCPYQPQDTSQSREIVVPTVSGVIILVLTVLTLIVKCGSNRRASKRRRRRGGDNIEYEGVPS